MFGNILSVAVLSVYILSGLCAARLLCRAERPFERAYFGCVFGMVMLLWLPALVSFPLGFTVLSQIIATVLAAAAGVICLLLSRRSPSPLCAERDIKHDLPALFALVPLFVLGAVLFGTHTIVDRNGALWVGQSTYGDLSMHLGFITSISEQTFFPPMYSICPDTPICYPFLSDSISSTFYTLGATLRFATVLPELFAYTLVLAGVYLFFDRWLENPKRAAFASLLFLVGGGFGFCYFLDLSKVQPGRFASLFTAFYETPTNDPSYGLRWVNTIADMLIPQRATLFGWSVLFACLTLLIRFVKDGEKRVVPVLGVLAGSLPLIHTHSFLALGVISGGMLIRSLVRRESKEKLLHFFIYAAIAVVLAAPQLFLFTFRQSGGFLRWNWNWVNDSDSFLWFYVKNWGLLFLLLPFALLTVKRETRSMFVCTLPLWLLVETVQFQPNPYDNNKLLFIVFAFLCGTVADFLADAFLVLREKSAGDTAKKAALHLGAVLVTAVLFLSGILTLGRELNSSYMLIGKEETEASAFIKENTEPDSVFLTHNNHNNAVAVLTGRNIVCGSGSFLFYHGVDYAQRENALAGMFADPETNIRQSGNAFGVDYVYVGPYERASYDIDTEWFDRNGETVFDNGPVVIYRLNPGL